MWTFQQSSGRLFDKTYHPVGIGYSGHLEGLNNPDLQERQGIGPIPRGVYKIGEPHDTDSHGPYVMRLEPLPENEMFGRSGFLIHGDSRTAPGSASLGCIILNKVLRQQIWESGDHLIGVIK